jgi:hypothetical protein
VPIAQEGRDETTWVSDSASGEQTSSASIAPFVLRIHLLDTSKGAIMERVLNSYLTLTSAVQFGFETKGKRYEQRYA